MNVCGKSVIRLIDGDRIAEKTEDITGENKG